MDEEAKTEEQLAARRLSLVQDQIVRKLPGSVRRKILCPYCGHWNLRGRQFCCDTLRKAVIAILSARRALATADAAERTMLN